MRKVDEEVKDVDVDADDSRNLSWAVLVVCSLFHMLAKVWLVMLSTG